MKKKERAERKGAEEAMKARTAAAVRRGGFLQGVNVVGKEGHVVMCSGERVGPSLGR